MSDKTSQDSEVKMSFIEHLEELRKRIIRSLLAILAGMIGCWFFREEILDFMFAPLYTAWEQVDGLPAIENLLNFSSLIEPFVAQLKLSALGGVFVAAPVVLYQFWKFIAPGLYPKEKKLAAPFVIVSSVLFVGGSIMAYSIVFPIGFSFFLEFAAGREMKTVETAITIASVEDYVRPAQQPGLFAPPVTSPKLLSPPETPASPALDTDPDTDTDTGTDKDTAAEGSAAEPIEQKDVSTETGSIDDTDTGEANGADPPAPQEPEVTQGAAATTSTSPAKSDSVDTLSEGDFAVSQPHATTSKGPKRPREEAQKPVEGSWYDFLFTGFSKDDCAELEATQGVEGKTVILTLTWNRNSCGKAPPIEKVLINGERVETSFSSVRAPVGRSAFEAGVPAPSTSGEHRIEVLYPKNPHTKKLSPVLMISDYLSFSIRILLAFGLIFELPILISFLSFAGIVNYKQLISFSRWFIVIAVVVAAMLTPPDVVTQLMLAAPLVLLYFISIGVAFFFGPKVE